MEKKIRIALAQLDPTVGDIEGNLSLIREARARASDEGADLIVAPELSIIGYPPEDLVLKGAAVDDCMRAIRALAAETADGGPAVILGGPCPDPSGAGVYNAVFLLDEGTVAATRFKHDLPNYGVFDEKRVFKSGPVPAPVDWRGVRLGLPVCEDIWAPEVPRALIEQGAELLICINGSPWRRTINAERREAFSVWFDEWEGSVPLIFLNQVGGQDELVFDGASFVWNEPKEPRADIRLKPFAADFEVVTASRSGAGWRVKPGRIEDRAEGEAGEYAAACLAVGDYVDKNGFPGVVIGLSGGIDSALTAVMAVDALGPERVWCVALPSRFTSQASLEDADLLAETLGCRFDVIQIEAAHAALSETLSPFFEDRPADATEENLQSRIRGVILMALSNKFGPMVLTTGNKSEMAVGYATLYGDMNGGYNALKDIYKTEVYALSRWRNANKPDTAKGPDGVVIPERVIEKPPSAELRADQTDQDSLPEYEVLDDILRGLVDREEEIEKVIARGHDAETVMRIQRLLYLAEYKRRQAPPGAKVGGRNFGRDRRYPITNKYRDQVD